MCILCCIWKPFNFLGDQALVEVVRGDPASHIDVVANLQAGVVHPGGEKDHDHHDHHGHDCDHHDGDDGPRNIHVDKDDGAFYEIGVGQTWTPLVRIWTLDDDVVDDDYNVDDDDGNSGDENV